MLNAVESTPVFASEVALVGGRIDYEVAAANVERDSGIPRSDALAALQDSKVLSDFVNKYWTSDAVGAMWVTYDNGYQVHAREIDGGDKAAIPELARVLGKSVSVHLGGASLGALNRAAAYLAEKYPTALFNLNVQEGYVDLAEVVSIPATVIDPAFVRVVKTAPAEVLVPATAHAGQYWDRWTGTTYVSNCTVGFTYRIGTTGSAGVATAAHCADGWHQARDAAAVQGETTSSSMTLESCALDVQEQWFASGVGYAVNRWTNPVSYDLVSGVATTYWVGETSVTSGLHTGYLWDVVLGYGTWSHIAGGDCGAGTVTGLKVDNGILSGDSGGPILLVNNFSSYFAGIISSGNGGGFGIGTWIGLLPLPGGAHICTQLNPC